jgi:putative transposase
MSELDTSGSVEGLGRATSPVYSTDVEELLRERGVTVTYEAIRKWCRKFGQQYTNQLRRHRSRPGDKWQMDEMFLTIKGERHYLWRAIAQESHVLDILVQRRRDKRAAKKVSPWGSRTTTSAALAFLRVE